MRLFYITLCLLLFAFSGTAQTKIGDVTEDFSDLRGDVFKERTLVGKVVGVHDGDTATVLRKQNAV